MKVLLKIISFLGLGFTFVPSLFVFKEIITMQTHFALMVVGLVLWFSASPFWMESKSLEEEE